MFAIIIIFLLGISLILAIEKITLNKLNGILLFPMSFLLGTFFIATQLIILSFIFHRWEPMWLLLLNGMFVILIGVWCQKRCMDIIFSLGNLPKLLNKEIIILLIILSGIFIFFWNTQLQNDFVHSDAMAYWFMKAKLFFEDRSINPQTIVEASEFMMTKYPPLSSLGVTWIYLLDQKVNILTGKYLWLFVEISLIIFLFWCSNKIFPKYKFSGLIAPILYLGIPQNVWHYSVHHFGFADIWFATYLMAGISLIYFWMIENKNHYLILGSLLLAGAGITRIEGLIVLWIIPLVFFANNTSKHLGQKILSSIIISTLIILWYGFVFNIKGSMGYEDQVFRNISNWQNFVPRTLTALQLMFLGLLKIKTFSILWPLFFISIFLVWIKKLDSFNFIWIKSIILIGFIFLAINYIFAAVEMNSFIKESMDRYAWEFAPLAIFIILLNIKQLISDHENKSIISK